MKSSLFTNPKAMTKELFLTIPATIEGLEEAVEQIMDERTRTVVLEAIRTRKKWRSIKEDYKIMRNNGVPAHEAIERLQKQYRYSEKTIEAIIYSR